MVRYSLAEVPGGVGAGLGSLAAHGRKALSLNTQGPVRSRIRLAKTPAIRRGRPVRDGADNGQTRTIAWTAGAYRNCCPTAKLMG